MRRSRLTVSVLFLSVLGAAALAMEPPDPGAIDRYRADGTLAARLDRARAIGNHRVDARLVERTHRRLESALLTEEGIVPPQPAPPDAWDGMPTTGDVQVLTLLIAFSDYAPTNTQPSIDAKLFGDGSGGYPYESLRNYYRRSSYDQLEIGGNTLGWYTTAYPRSDVAQTTTGRQTLLKEVLSHYDAQGHDFTQYDNDGDGTIDYFVVVWTGPDNGWGNFWWGYQTWFYDSTYRLDGKRLGKYSWQWESRPVGGTFNPRVVIHETGHALGLPDYYDYDESVGPDGGVGGLDMMDGNWGDHNCFSKFLLDWITPTVIANGTHSVSLAASSTSQDAIVFVHGATGDLFREYFMAQTRTKTGNDASHPGQGLLVWHVDATLDSTGRDYEFDNSYTTHKLLRLMEADGLEEIEQDRSADADDYYVAGRQLGPATLPSNARYDGVANPLELTSISAAGNPMTAQIREIGARQLRIGEGQATEGNSGTKQMQLTVTLEE